MKLNHIYKSIACGVLLAMTATSCDLDYNPVDTNSDVTEGVKKKNENDGNALIWRGYYHRKVYSMFLLFSLTQTAFWNIAFLTYCYISN